MSERWVSSDELLNMGGRWVRIIDQRTYENGRMEFLVEFLYWRGDED